MSNMAIHNRLNGAYHEVDMHRFAPSWSLMWRIPAFLVPSKVRNVVKDGDLIADILNRTERAREAIESVRGLLDVDKVHVVNTNDRRPYPHLHRSVKAVYEHKPGWSPTWTYSFNPYRVAMDTLDTYEQFVRNVWHAKVEPFGRLSRIHRMAKKLESNVRLVEGQTWFL